MYVSYMPRQTTPPLYSVGTQPNPTPLLGCCPWRTPPQRVRQHYPRSHRYAMHAALESDEKGIHCPLVQHQPPCPAHRNPHVREQSLERGDGSATTTCVGHIRVGLRSEFLYTLCGEMEEAFLHRRVLKLIRTLV